ncbi:MAG: alpha/beta fold hydrolase [Bacteroidales bacterium]
MKLHFRKYGKAGPPLVIVHGLYGSGDNWISVARDLASDFEVFVVDQRNHGKSPHSDEHDYPSMRDDLKEFMDAQEIEEAVLLGHSMGGKTVMFFADAWPGRVQSLISVDIAPKPYHDMALQSNFAANHAKMIDAMMEVDLSKMESREEIDQALRTSIGSGRIRGFLLKNVQRDKKGNFYWQINLKALRDHLDDIFDGLDTDRIIAGGGISGFPALFVSGENSDYIRAEDHDLIRSVFPSADIVTIPGAGHWLHAEQPELLVKNIRYFLNV